MILSCPLSPSAASSRDLLRTSGGLAYVLDLLYNSFSSPKLQQTALYTLGCAAERNRKNWYIRTVAMSLMAETKNTSQSYLHMYKIMEVSFSSLFSLPHT